MDHRLERGKSGCRGTYGVVHTPLTALPLLPAHRHLHPGMHSPHSVPCQPGATGQVSHIKSHLCGQRGGRLACHPHRDAASRRATQPLLSAACRHPWAGALQGGADAQETHVTWPFSGPRTRAAPEAGMSVRPGQSTSGGRGPGAANGTESYRHPRGACLGTPVNTQGLGFKAL